jgi:hypothetical protein
MHRKFLALAVLGSLAGACADEPAERGHVELGPGYESPQATAPAPLTAREITQYADANNDGKVTRDEAKADPALAKRFDKYDLNNDDVLDRGEFARLEGQRGAQPRSATADGWTFEVPTTLPPDMQDVEVSSDPSLNRTGVSHSHRAIRQ